jgi:hypothetical protein
LRDIFPSLLRITCRTLVSAVTRHQELRGQDEEPLLYPFDSCQVTTVSRFESFRFDSACSRLGLVRIYDFFTTPDAISIERY